MSSSKRRHAVDDGDDGGGLAPPVRTRPPSLQAPSPPSRKPSVGLASNRPSGRSSVSVSTHVGTKDKMASALKPNSTLASPRSGDTTTPPRLTFRGSSQSIVEKPNAPRNKRDTRKQAEAMPPKIQPAGKKDDKSSTSLKTKWDRVNTLVQRALKPCLKALSEKDDLLPDPDELEKFEDARNDDEEQRYMDDIRDEMVKGGHLSEREIAAFFIGFTVFNAKVKSLQSQLESAKKMSITSSIRKLADHKQTSRQSNVRRLADSKGNMISCKSLSIRLIRDDPRTSAVHQKLLNELEEAEKKQRKLEKQLKQAGLQIAEDIPYHTAKEKVESITKRMQAIGSSEATHVDKKKQAELREEYFRLEQEMEKYSTALVLTDEYIEEQEKKEMEWDRNNEQLNMEALEKMRRHMPVNVKSLTEAQLCSQPTPNGKMLPKAIARRFKRTNVLQLIRTDPEHIARMHPSTLENISVTGMTLTEKRAVYAHLKDVGSRWKAMQSDPTTERKWIWWSTMRTNLKEAVNQYEFHVEQFGPPENHPYATRDNPKGGCPMIGKQCPIRADQEHSYNDDYGFPDGAEYEIAVAHRPDATQDAGARAASDAATLAREKRATERLDALKKHYKGVLQVSLASASCESMDEVLDTMESNQTTWIENGIKSKDKGMMSEDEKRKETMHISDSLNDLRSSISQLAERSGMQLTGTKEATANHVDIRSGVELGLCEEVCDLAKDYFSAMEQRMRELDIKDGRSKTSMSQLRELLDELHERNLTTLDTLGVETPSPSKKRKTRYQIVKEAKAKVERAQEAIEPKKPEGRGMAASALAARPGGFLAEIAARKRG